MNVRLHGKLFLMDFEIYIGTFYICDNLHETLFESKFSFDVALLLYDCSNV